MFALQKKRPRFNTLSILFVQMSTLERKKKNFSFTRKFPFMKSRDNIDDLNSEGERKIFFLLLRIAMVMTGYMVIFCNFKVFETVFG